MYSNNLYFSIAVSVYLDESFQQTYGNGVKELRNMFNGKHGIERIFNLRRGLKTKFIFSVVDVRRLKYSTYPSNDEMRYTYEYSYWCVMTK